MGWKGTVRSIGATVRAAEREAKRREREIEREREYLAKLQEMDQAAYEVKVFEDLIEAITSLHKKCSASMDWRVIANQKEPLEPKRDAKKEVRARQALESYRPGFIGRLLKLEEKKREKLSKAIDLAIIKDDGRYQKSLNAWKKKKDIWDSEAGLAKRVLDGNDEARLEAIEKMQKFSEIEFMGSKVNCTINNGLLEAELNVHSQDIIPAESKSLLSSGRLSVKKMPVSRFNEIYQDYVCSSVLRMARELLSLLPEDVVIVTATDKMLNTATGHIEELPILSAAIPKATIEKINMDRIDPSDSMRNFVTNMSFRKTKGFEPVEKVQWKGDKYT